MKKDSYVCAPMNMNKNMDIKKKGNSNILMGRNDLRDGKIKEWRRARVGRYGSARDQLSI